MPTPVKLTRAHQVTLPKRLLQQAGWLNQEFFVADLKQGQLVLSPLTIAPPPAISSLADLRRHFGRIGITQHDVTHAVAWARRHERPSSRRSRKPR